MIPPPLRPSWAINEPVDSVIVLFDGALVGSYWKKRVDQASSFSAARKGLKIESRRKKATDLMVKNSVNPLTFFYGGTCLLTGLLNFVRPHQALLLCPMSCSPMSGAVFAFNAFTANYYTDPASESHN
jgi:hypothetical protein